MKVLNQTADRADPVFCGDVAVLHINHSMDNTFYFNEVLKRVFPDLVFIALPYNHRQPPDNLSYPCYYEAAKGWEDKGRETGENVKSGVDKAGRANREDAEDKGDRTNPEDAEDKRDRTDRENTGNRGDRTNREDEEVKGNRENRRDKERNQGSRKVYIWKNGGEVGPAGADFTQTIRFMVEHAVMTEIVPKIREGKKLLIVEDGGLYAEAAARIRDREPMLDRAVLGIVEQTTLGTRRCMDGSGRFRYACPCASVAKSDVKMYFESIFIGQRIVEELSALLRGEDAFFSFYHVMICGYGIIGRSVAKALAGRRCEITVVDRHPEVSALAKREGYTVFTSPDKNLFYRDTIWIGCVGRPVFGREWLCAFLEGQGEALFLASGSSRDVEFEYFLCYLEGGEPAIDGLTLKQVKQGAGCRRYWFEYRGKTKKIILIAEGRPVNFYAEQGDSLTYQVIDLVFSEMLGLALFLCSQRELPARLYLLGAAPELEEAFSEEELLLEWCGQRRVSVEGRIIDYLDGHPLGKLLRAQLLDGLYITKNAAGVSAQRRDESS